MILECFEPNLPLHFSERTVIPDPMCDIVQAQNSYEMHCFRPGWLNFQFWAFTAQGSHQSGDQLFLSLTIWQVFRTIRLGMGV